MVNWELKLIAKIIETNDLKTPITERITADTLHHADARSMFDYLHESYSESNTLPTGEMMADLFPSVRLPTHVQDDLSVLCSHVRKTHLASELKKEGVAIAELAESSPDEALAHLDATNTRLAARGRNSQSLILSESTAELKRKYDLTKRLRRSGKTLGIEYPWPALTNESMGMLPGEFILFYGRPKNMKTFILCHIAAHVYFRRNKRVLFFTREMSPEQIQARVLCCITETNYGDYRKGMMDEETEEEFFRVSRGLSIHEQKSMSEEGQKKESGFIIAADTQSDGGGVSSLRAMIQQYNPDILFVDGLYLMRDDKAGTRSRDWKNIANITSDLKLLSQQAGIPIVANTQANRAGEDKRRGGKNLTDVAFSDASGQDADLIIKVVKEEDSEGNQIINLLIGGSREFSLPGLVIGGEPCTDFRFKRIWTDRKSPEGAIRDQEDKAAGVAEAQVIKLEGGTQMRVFQSDGAPIRTRLSRKRREDIASTGSRTGFRSKRVKTGDDSGRSKRR